MKINDSEYQLVSRYLSPAPVNVIRIIEELGIDYAETNMKSGADGRIDFNSGEVKITVNSDQSSQRKRFTAAHELAHYLLHKDLLAEQGHLDRIFSFPNDNPSAPLSPRHEVEANKLAAAILMPEKTIRSDLGWVNFDLESLASHFSVSVAAMEIRLKVLRINLSEEKSKQDEHDRIHAKSLSQ